MKKKFESFVAYEKNDDLLNENVGLFDKPNT